ncbi:DUF4129 domain-containing protein [Microbacterium sp. NPDC028030]|uniref:DUF4129 domain-containing protein n=1 Tax=Microbacterium sp. NPDC028030 TaxID=3155124 RepID=UPI0033CD7DC9
MSRTEAPVEVDRRVVGLGVMRVLLPLIAVVGLFAILMFAAAQQGRPQFGVLPDAEPEPIDAEIIEPLPSETTPPPMVPTEDSPLLRIIGIVLAVLVAVAVLALLFSAARILVRFLRGLWRDRPLTRREASEVEATTGMVATPEPEPDAETIRRGIDEAIRTIDARPSPGDSIVAAWVGLEESAADAGAGRGVNETPSEFTARIIGRRAGIGAEVVTLLGLYEQVRFGGVDADEGDRAAAASCLRGIQAGWR